MFRLIHKRMKGEKGFTLIELLVVIIIIAILAAIAIPTFLGQRQKAQDAAAKSLVRNAMTAVESYYVDGQSFTGALTDGTDGKTPLAAIEPSITFTVGDAAATTAGADAAASAVTVTLGDQTYEVGTKSKSEKIFGVAVDKTAGNKFYVGGVESNWAGTTATPVAP